MERVTLAVENMNCGGCMRKIEQKLGAAPGVEAARANLSAKRVTVLFKHGATDADGLVETLKQAGYKAGPLTATTSEEQVARERGFLRRLGVAGFAAMNVMLLSISVWSSSPGDMSPGVMLLFHWLSALIALPAIVYAGQPFFKSAITALKARTLNMDVPISLGVILAGGMSLVQTMRGAEHVYFDAAITLLFFLLIGRYLDQRMRTRAQGAAQNLIGMMSSTATMIGDDGQMHRVPADALSPGMKVLVAVGERVPVDGRLLIGTSEIDDSLITGESIPHRVTAGDEVFAGTLNIAAPVTVEAVATENDTLLAEIGRLMEAAEQGRGRYVRLADRAAAIYAPAVHGLALATGIGWILFGAGWEAALVSAIAVLIITCPCALALAVPAVQVAASSRLFDNGIILKAPDALERLAEVDVVVFDKTGTLSKGEPRLIGVMAGGESLALSGAGSELDVGVMAAMRQAAQLAANSRHPYAVALVAAVAELDGAASREAGQSVGNDGQPGSPEANPGGSAEEIPGSGLLRKVKGGEQRLGSAAWVGIEDNLEAEQASLWYSAPGQMPLAFQFEDGLRDDATEVVAQLQQAGYRVELLSGDRHEAVERAARTAGIDVWRARQKPQDKIARLDALKAAGHKVVMVGDGLNDAPALAAAHASLSPSSASEFSQSAADAIMQGGALSPMLEILAVAKASKRMAFQNFGIAAGYNAIFVPMAMLGIVTPLIAAIAMSASSIVVTGNAIRLRSKHLSL